MGLIKNFRLAVQIFHFLVKFFFKNHSVVSSKSGGIHE